MNDKNCEGCYLYRRRTKLSCNVACNFNPSCNGKICPCANCIIKIMCEDVCEEYEKYIQYIKGKGHYE